MVFMRKRPRPGSRPRMRTRRQPPRETDRAKTGAGSRRVMARKMPLFIMLLLVPLLRGHNHERKQNMLEKIVSSWKSISRHPFPTVSNTETGLVPYNDVQTVLDKVVVSLESLWITPETIPSFLRSQRNRVKQNRLSEFLYNISIYLQNQESEEENFETWGNLIHQIFQVPAERSSSLPLLKLQDFLVSLRGSQNWGTLLSIIQIFLKAVSNSQNALSLLGQNWEMLSGVMDTLFQAMLSGTLTQTSTTLQRVLCSLMGHSNCGISPEELHKLMLPFESNNWKPIVNVQSGSSVASHGKYRPLSMLPESLKEKHPNSSRLNSLTNQAEVQNVLQIFYRSKGDNKGEKTSSSSGDSEDIVWEVLEDLRQSLMKRMERSAYDNLNKKVSRMTGTLMNRVSSVIGTPHSDLNGKCSIGNLQQLLLWGIKHNISWNIQPLGFTSTDFPSAPPILTCGKSVSKFDRAEDHAHNITKRSEVQFWQEPQPYSEVLEAVCNDSIPGLPGVSNFTVFLYCNMYNETGYSIQSTYDLRAACLDAAWYLSSMEEDSFWVWVCKEYFPVEFNVTVCKNSSFTRSMHNPALMSELCTSVYNSSDAVRELRNNMRCSDVWQGVPMNPKLLKSCLSENKTIWVEKICKNNTLSGMPEDTRAWISKLCYLHTLKTNVLNVTSPPCHYKVWDQRAFKNSTLVEECKGINVQDFKDHVCRNSTLYVSMKDAHPWVADYCVGDWKNSSEEGKCFLRKLADMLPLSTSFDTSQLCRNPISYIIGLVSQLSQCDSESSAWALNVHYLLKMLNFLFTLTEFDQIGKETRDKLGEAILLSSLLDNSSFWASFEMNSSLTILQTVEWYLEQEDNDSDKEDLLSCFSPVLWELIQKQDNVTAFEILLQEYLQMPQEGFQKVLMSAENDAVEQFISLMHRSWPQIQVSRPDEKRLETLTSMVIQKFPLLTPQIFVDLSQFIPFMSIPDIISFPPSLLANQSVLDAIRIHSPDMKLMQKRAFAKRLLQANLYGDITSWPPYFLRSVEPLLPYLPLSHFVQLNQEQIKLLADGWKEIKLEMVQGRYVARSLLNTSRGDTEEQIQSYICYLTYEDLQRFLPLQYPLGTLEKNLLECITDRTLSPRGRLAYALVDLLKRVNVHVLDTSELITWRRLFPEMGVNFLQRLTDSQVVGLLPKVQADELMPAQDYLLNLFLYITSIMSHSSEDSDCPVLDDNTLKSAPMETGLNDLSGGDINPFMSAASAHLKQIMSVSVQSAMQKISLSLAETLAQALQTQTPVGSTSVSANNVLQLSVSESTSAIGRKGGKCIAKQKHIDPAVVTAPDRDVSHMTLPSGGSIEAGGIVPQKRPSMNEEDKRVKRRSKRQKPDSYCSSDSEDSSDYDWTQPSTDESESGVLISEKNKSADLSNNTKSNPDIVTILEARGDPLFDPEGIKHPRSSEWSPISHIGQYLENWVRKPLNSTTRSKLRAECPRPVVNNKVCETPILDSKIVQFLSKSGKDPRKGIDRSLKACQDKLLDILGPITKIFELAEEALKSKSPVDVHVLRGWVQRAICLLGNANSALASERRRAILLKLDPKLADMATSEPGQSAKGLLFGDSFIKELGTFVASFTALDKAQASMKRVFQSKVFGRAGRGRGRSSSRTRPSQQRYQGPELPSFRSQPPSDFRTQSPFFPQRGRPWRSRGIRGQTRARSYADQWVLQTVLGYQIEFYTPPVQKVVPDPFVFSRADAKLVDAEVGDLLQKDAIRFVSDDNDGFISNIFLVKKKDAGLRPVINLCELNLFVLYRHFKMEGIHLLRDLLLPADWLVKIDLKDAYLTVPMAPISQAFLRFLWQGQTWQFTCLPFGLSSAPWCFTKLLKPVIYLLRSQGVRLIIYLDDILLMSQDRLMLHTHVEWTIRLLTDLGFLINWKKSHLNPTRQLEFLGFVVDSDQASLRLPGSKIRTIRKEIRAVLRKERISLRLLARIVGLLSASIQAIFPGPLHYRALQRLKALHLRRGLGYADLICLSSDAREELVWWLKHLEAWNGRDIFGMVPDLVIESDASLLGWGARLGNVATGGKWSQQERDLHINCLELLAGSFALKSLAKDKVQCCILLKMDNISAVQYINRLGGTKSKQLAELAKDFWHFCLDRNVTVLAEYLPGLSNVVADWNSRYLSDRSDWMLDREVFSLVEHLWGPFQIDLFASRLNRQLPTFFSWRPDPEALATDAFLQSWVPGIHYAFPPFAMIPRVLLSVRRQGATVVLITPLWPTQPWFRPLLELSADIPRSLPIFPCLLTDPTGQPHELLVSGDLQLIAWFLSGVPQVPESFRTQLASFWRNHGHRVPGPCIPRLGHYGIVGKAYRTINSYRSAISAGHELVDGFPIGQHALVAELVMCRFHSLIPVLSPELLRSLSPALLTKACQCLKPSLSLLSAAQKAAMMQTLRRYVHEREIWPLQLVCLLPFAPLKLLYLDTQILLRNMSLYGELTWMPQQTQYLWRKIQASANLTKSTILALGSLANGIECDTIQKLNTISEIKDVVKYLHSIPSGLRKSLRKCILEEIQKRPGLSWEDTAWIGPEFVTDLPVKLIDRLSNESMKMFLEHVHKNPRSFLELQPHKKTALVQRALHVLHIPVQGEIMAKDLDLLGPLVGFTGEENILRINRRQLLLHLDELATYCLPSEFTLQLGKMLTDEDMLGHPTRWTKKDIEHVGRLIFYLTTENIHSLPKDVLGRDTLEWLLDSQRQWEESEMGKICRKQSASLQDKMRRNRMILTSTITKTSFRGIREPIPSCSDMRITLPSAWAAVQISWMSLSEFEDCLGLISQDIDLTADQAKAALAKTKQLFGPVKTMSLVQILQVGHLITHLNDKELQEMAISDWGVVSVLGRMENWTPKQMRTLVSSILRQNSKGTSSLDLTELTALGYLLCGLGVEELKKINRKEFSQAAVFVGSLKLKCSEAQMETLAELLTSSSAFGSVSRWGAEVFTEIGTIAAGLPDIVLSSMIRDQIEGLTPDAISIIPAPKFAVVFSPAQLSFFTSDQAMAVTQEQYVHLSYQQRQALSSAQYEGEVHQDPRGENSARPLIGWTSLPYLLAVILFLM
ncbi:stereocilin [Rhinophrynus dorsalis]